MKLRKTKILFCIMILVGMIAVIPNSVFARTSESDTLQIEGVLDGYQMINLFSFGVNHLYDLDIISYHLEPHGLTTHNVAPINPVTDVLNNTFSDIDYLCSEITITDYDVLVVCDECNTTDYPSAMSLIMDAYNEGLIIVGLGYGPLLLAELDIISGKNITCSWDGGASQTIIENAGATYNNPLYGPYVDLPFITAAHNYENLYLLVATALGVDLDATTTPSVANDLPITSIVFIICVALSSFLFKKKRR